MICLINPKLILQGNVLIQMCILLSKFEKKYLKGELEKGIVIIKKLRELFQNFPEGIR